MKRIKIPLPLKLSLIVTLICGVALLIQGQITFKLSTKALKTSVNSHLLSIANDVSNQVDAMNTKEFTSLRILADTSIIRSETATLQQKQDFLTATVKRMGSQYENIAYLDINGTNITRDGRKVNLSSREYFKQAIKGNDYIMDPYYSAVFGGILMTYAIPVYSDSNKIIGVLSLLLIGNPMEELCKTIDLGYGMNPTVINLKSGQPITSSNQTNDNSNADENNENAIDPSSPLGMIFADMYAGNSGTGDFVDAGSNMKITCSYTLVPNSDWAVLCCAPYSYYYKSVDKFKRAIIFVLLGSILICALVSSLLIKFFIKPLSNVKTSIKDIADGNADLTKRIEHISGDEVGDVVIGFNKFVETLQNIVKNIKDSRESLAIADSDLQATTEDASTTISQMSDNIDNVNKQIVNQVNSVTETAGAVNQIASNIDSLDRMIEKQAEGVSQASSAVEEMIGNINSVNNAVEKMVSSFTLLEENTNSGINTQNIANDKIKQIEEESKMLQDANMAIASIAEQTNLLAMNAAIEAAHAGEAGKGFSVVADEIRKLSETSSQQSKTIGDELNKIQDSIETVVATSADANIAFSAVSKSINETSQIVMQIKAAMEEQQIGSKQIIDVLHTMNDSTAEVRAAGQEMQEGNKQILIEVNKLQDASNSMKDSMKEMSAGALKMNETGTALSGISSKVSENVKQISTEIDKFKV